MPPEIAAAARSGWDQVEAAVDDHHLEISLINGDPGPDSFLLNDAGPRLDALIDWSTALRGSLLYDLASFRVLTMSAWPAAAGWFAAGYLSETPQIEPELQHLDVVIKARWIANAIYFASRIERGITRGARSPTASEDGLAQAYRGLTQTADAG
jgi:Ser/Thr protein kinase RdoA (MazF antagonist)